MTTHAISDQMPPQPGQVLHPGPGLRMVLAPNPSPMTLWGTNTFILGTGAVAVIDPGPADPDHLAAILAALAPGERISHIFVTHAHLDHSPLAAGLAAATGAPVLAFGGATAGRSKRMVGMAGLGGGEGLDHAFAPDILLRDGETVRTETWQLRALHTPGHIGGHLCFAWEDQLFCGDHVMGWAPSLISPPDGDMGDYMASLERLRGQHWRHAWPAHGAPVGDLAARIDALVTHRRAREASVLNALAAPSDLPALLARVYADIPAALLPAAQRNLLAHLIDLIDRREVFASTPNLPDAHFYRR